MTSSPPRSGNTATIPWWIWPNLLGLDAPLVALSWLYAIGHVTERPVLPAASLALFFSVWTIYLLDRWLDAGKATIEPNLRHQFGKLHRQPIGLGALITGAVAGGVAIFALEEEMIRTGLVVALFVAVYFLIFVKLAKWSAAKEMSCGMGFAGGIFVADRAQFVVPDSLVWVGLLLVATLNCLVIRAAESVVPEKRTVIGAIFSLALVVPLGFAWFGLSEARSLELALIVAAVLLPSLWYLHSRGWATTRATRVLADVALVVPLIIVFGK